MILKIDYLASQLSWKKYPATANARLVAFLVFKNTKIMVKNSCREPAKGRKFEHEQKHPSPALPLNSRMVPPFGSLSYFFSFRVCFIVRDRFTFYHYFNIGCGVQT